jgi:hypothetical protein
MLSDTEKLKVLEPLFDYIIVPRMMLWLAFKVDRFGEDVMNMTLGKCGFSEMGKLCLCLNRATRRRVLACMKNYNNNTFMAFMQAHTRNWINTWIWDNTCNHFNIFIDNERFVLRLKACDFSMPTEDDPEHSVVRVTASGHNASTQDFEYSEKTAMVDYCFGYVFTEDVNMHLTRIMLRTHRFFESRAREQEDEANMKGWRKLGNFATPTSCVEV